MTRAAVAKISGEGSELEHRLRDEVDAEIRFDRTSRALYATDASNYRIVPLGVVLPRSPEGLLATLACCSDAGIPVTTRGGGTSTGGQAVGPGVVVDCSRYLDRVLEIDPDRRIARVQPGVVLDSLQLAALPHGLCFGPDPSTHDRCTLGGMIGNNACGAHSLRHGKTDDNVEVLQVACYDGALLTVSSGLRPTGDAARVDGIEAMLSGLLNEHGGAIRDAFAPVLPRRVSGYGLHHLLPEHGSNLARALVGTEGTCVSLLEATVRLVPVAASKALVVLGFPDVYAAAAFVPELLPLEPLTIEGLDERVVALSEAAGRRGSIELLGGGGAWLLVEVGGPNEEAAAAAGKALVASLGDAIPSGWSRVVSDRVEQRAIWRIREDGAGLATRLPGGGEAFPGLEDAAVPPENLATYLRAFDGLLLEHHRRGVHYGHYGEGCVHIRIDFDFRSRSGVSDFRRFMEDAADLIVSCGGSLSGEHGDGQARSELLSRQYGPEVLQAFAAFKDTFDPSGLMNPGRIVSPRRIDADLRVRTMPFALSPTTTLALASDHQDLGAASRRCVGVGRCRRLGGGGMCPSFQVTRDETHSTRGRARMLAEMLEGEVIEDGWQSEEVAEALDLCLACKACKSDCPVGVDMATYKAEFLSHYYEQHARPRAHYSLGYLPVLARLASVSPRLVNWLLGGQRGAPLRRLAGIDPARRLPLFPRRPFRRDHRDKAALDQVDAVLFTDTFNNLLEPQVSHAACEVLEACDVRVGLPTGAVCCGLTWYTTGQFDTARWVLRRTLGVLEESIDAGLPIVTLEPSCASMLAHDAAELFAARSDQRWQLLAERLSDQLVSFGSYVANLDQPERFRELSGPLVTQVHCHEQADGGSAPEQELLSRLGAVPRVASGCCGMAGNFGMEAAHRELSVKLAETGVLALTNDDASATVLADGFSCRAQVRDLSENPVLHIAEILRAQLTKTPLRG